MKKICVIMLLMLIGVTSLIACQPTPDKPFIVSKGDGKLLAAINAPPVPALEAPYTAPETWTETIHGKVEDRLTIEVDAKITVPDVLEYPVYEAIFSDYDQEAFENFLHNTVGDVDMFESHEYVTDEIIRYDDDGNPIYQTYYYMNVRDSQGIIDAIDYQINDPNSPLNRYYLPQCQNEDEKEQPITALLNRKEISEWFINNQSEVLIKTDKQYASVPAYDIHGWPIWFTEDGEQKVYIQRKMNEMCILGYEPDASSVSVIVQDLRILAKTTDLWRVSIDAESAQEQADIWLQNLGLNGWELANIGAAKTVMLEDILVSWVYFYGFGSAYNKDEYAHLYAYPPEAYVFTYTPSQSGIPTLYFSNKQNNDYNNSDWMMPYLQVAVNDSGVIHVKLVNGSSGFGECLNTNVALLSFEEIQAKFRDYIVMNTDFAGRVFGENEEDTMREYTYHEMTRVHIDDVRLGYIKVKKIDSDEYMTIPAWCFYGKQYDRFSEESQFVLDENSEARLETTAGHVFLCINAIDGSIIDLTKGY